VKAAPAVPAIEADLEQLASVCARLLLSWHQKQAEVDAEEASIVQPVVQQKSS
jgi:hypothetical protein